jgi:hypothetical protein
MRHLFFLIGLFALTAYRCQQQGRNEVGSVVQPGDSVIVNAELINFKSSIQPILKLHCSPCHFPGGKMYSRMPFDSATTIVAHKDGILRRIKDSTENEKLKLFIDQELN